MPNSVTHFGIYAQNPAGVAEFDRNIFGWRIEQMPGIDYWRVDTAARTKAPTLVEGDCIAT